MKKIPVLIAIMTCCTQITWANPMEIREDRPIMQIEQEEKGVEGGSALLEKEQEGVQVPLVLEKWEFETNKPLGKLKLSPKKVSLGDRTYDLYSLEEGGTYLSLAALKNMGFKEEVREGGLQLMGLNTPYLGEIPELQGETVTFSEKAIYVGPYRFYGLEAGGQLLISTKALEGYFESVIQEGEIVLTPFIYTPERYVQLDAEGIQNKGKSPLEISFQRLYWEKGKVVACQEEAWELAPGEKRPFLKDETLSKEAKLLTTQLQVFSCEGVRIEGVQVIGEEEVALLERYEQKEEVPLLEDKETPSLFPAFIIQGSMRYATNGLYKGEKIQVWAAEDGVYYWVITERGEKIKVPWGSVKIPPNPGSRQDQPSNEEIEAFVNGAGLTSKTRYLVWTDLSRQYTYVFEEKKGLWKLLRRMPCSTGNNVTPTPSGEFELTNKVPFFGVEKGYRCKNAFQIFGDYLYHSVLFDVTGSWVTSGANQLGQQASHGCIRLSPENSLWFYNTMLQGTKVWIR